MFKSNAVRSLVELHEIELARFYDAWDAFRASGVALPETRDPNYASVDHVVGHVLRAARNYLVWIGKCVGRPVSDVDQDEDVLGVAAKGRRFMEDVLAAWRRHLAGLTDEELSPATYRSRWGEDFNIGQMLEHAVVHPMRHRIQLERLMLDSQQAR